MPEQRFDAWTRFERFLAEHLPALCLAPPAAPRALDAFARAAGRGAVGALASLYRRHDGQEGEAPALFFGLRFLPLAEVGDEWSRWSAMVEHDPSLLADIAVASHPAGAVQPVYYSPAWLPFAADGAGNGLAVDLAPGPDGRPGQVIGFGADEAVRRVLAPSAEAFVEWCARACETGLATVAPDAGAPGGLALHIGGAAHLLDVAPALFADG